MKPVEFRGSSLDDLRAFPSTARRECGFQIDRVQRGLDPLDWKPFKTIGPGVNEIRIKDAEGEFRTMYVAKFEDAIYILHCFRKKTQKTSQSDIDVVRKRYKELVKELKK